MADNHPEQEDAIPSPPPEQSRRKALTPEQRRLLGTPRALPQRRHDEERTEEAVPEPVAPPPPAQKSPSATPSGAASADSPPSASSSSGAERPRSAAPLGETKSSRRSEMQRAFLILGILLFIGMIFYAGRKFDRMRYLVTSRANAQELAPAPEKFPGLTPEELVEAGLVAERQGDWKGAAIRFYEAKRKDLGYQGLLFRIGKSAYEHGDWAGADEALNYALKFGENVAAANHLRALIAVRQHDLSAADRFFEAAAKAEPLNADYFYYWGEALRIAQRPRDAIRRYQQAAQRSSGATETTLCRFKIRLARIEAAEAAAVAAEIAGRREAGPLSVDWLMTDAALQLHAGNIKEAARMISEARSVGVSGLFDPCGGDVVFRKAAEIHPEIAATLAPIGPNFR